VGDASVPLLSLKAEFFKYSGTTDPLKIYTNSANPSPK